jgi:LacI family transcriptional regulator
LSASVKDVAKSAGVSVGTVSNVLNHPHLVSAKVREKVELAMAELGFVRNESARQLRAGRSKTIAYIMLDATNPFFTDVAQGIEQSAAGADLALYLCNSDNRRERERAYLSRLEEQRVAGILITPLDPDDPSIEDISRRGTPVVIVDRTPSTNSHCSVAVNDVLGGRLAAEHLIDLGHVRIAFVGGPHTMGQVHERCAGAHDAVVAAGLAEDQFLRLDTTAPSVEEGRRAGSRLVGMPTSRRPTAAFCANDLLALGLLQECSALGVEVPGELAIVGYDDIEFAGAATVALTSVRQPRRQLGEIAGTLLLDEVNDPKHEHRHVVLTPELVARASTRRPSRGV